MKLSLKNKSWLFVGVIAIVCIGALGFTMLSAPKHNAFMRGERISIKMGCFNCHGPGGLGRTPNPGSESKKIPGWVGGTHMMYIESEDEISEWIRFGKPNRMQEKSPGLVQMPSYDSFLDEEELGDLIIFYKSVSSYPADMPEEANQGYQTAKRVGCFGCHGPEGRGGGDNPRSFKGYIPPWDGEDFTALVENQDELKEWIEHGTIQRFKNNPIASYFLDRQAIKMPAYQNELTNSEIEDIIQYIRWLRTQSN